MYSRCPFKKSNLDSGLNRQFFLTLKCILYITFSCNLISEGKVSHHI